MALNNDVDIAPRYIKYIGAKYNKLTINKVYREQNKTYCDCRCECGNTKNHMRFDSVKSGRVKSCGCNNIEQITNLGKSSKKYNTYDLTGKYGIGYTNKGEEFYFDLEDYDKIKDYTWYINNKGYVFSAKDEILMHRLVTNCPDNLIPDHIHGEKSTTDNRKSNLRIVNRSQNSMNVKIRSDNTSGITGISWDKRSNKWCVRIMVKGENIYLGYFNKDDLDKAIQARLDGEKKYFGEYSYTHSQKIPID